MFADDTEKKHKKDLETQMQFNAANNKGLARMTEKQTIEEEKLTGTSSRIYVLSFRFEAPTGILELCCHSRLFQN